MDGDEKGSQDAKTTRLILGFSLSSFKLGKLQTPLKSVSYFLVPFKSRRK